MPQPTCSVGALVEGKVDMRCKICREGPGRYVLYRPQGGFIRLERAANLHCYPYMRWVATAPGYYRTDFTLRGLRRKVLDDMYQEDKQ